jgi:hypothetical protein
MHYSVSREDCVVGHDPLVKPDLSALLAAGYKKQKLRAHSDLMWNQACNDWIAEFTSEFDIEVEAKGKNLASQQVYDHVFVKA